MELAYTTLRCNARRRGKEFTLTLDQFKQFCIKTEYLAGRGRTKTGYHIDRIEDDKGYTIDNIQKLTNTENITKENKRRKILKYDYATKEGWFADGYNPRGEEGDPL